MLEPVMLERRRTFLSWGSFFVLLYLYRSAYSLLGEVLILRFTAISDTQLYQAGIFEQGAIFWETLTVESAVGSGAGETILATGLTAALGGFFGKIFGGNPVLINIGFQTITFAGLVHLISVVKGPEKYYLAVLCMFPSFSLWTSIASKEAIVAAALAIVSAYVIRLYNREDRLNLIYVFAALVLYVYKAHYLAAIGYFWAVTVVGRRLRQRALAALLAGLLSLAALYVVADEVSRLAEFVQRTILSGPLGRSTRGELFFATPNDVYWKAPIGMFRAFFGPLVEEAGRSPLHLFSFIESSLLVGVFGFLLAIRLTRLPVYNVVVSFFVLFWIVFPNYPIGVMNPGSAVRYRSGWIILVIVIFATFLSRDLYVRWTTARASLPPRAVRVT